MSATNATTSADALLAHRDFVQRVARRLVRDPAEAEEIEQETWLRALRRGGARVGRGWIATVTRNAARERARSDVRRRDREERARREDVVPGDASESVARAELAQSLVEQILALDARQRDVLLLRYFDGLAPASVARRLGIPVETVRSRTRRALERLKGRLEGARGRGWRLALVPLLRPEKPTAGLMAGGTKVLVAAVAVVAVAGGVLLLSSGGDGERAPSLAGSAGGGAPAPAGGGAGGGSDSPPPVEVRPFLPGRGMEEPSRKTSAGTPGADASPGVPGRERLRLSVRIEPARVISGGDLTLVAVFHNVTDGPVDLHLPRFAGARPFPKWRFVREDGVTLVPRGRSFQSMWQRGVQGRVETIPPGGSHEVKSVPAGFATVDPESGRPRTWAPKVPLDPGVYEVHARHCHERAVVPFSNEAFKVVEKPWEGLWTGTLEAGSFLLRVEAGDRPQVRIDAPDEIRPGEPFPLGIRVRCGARTPLDQDGHWKVRLAAKGRAYTARDLPPDELVLAAGEERVVATADLAEMTWRKESGFPRRRRGPEGGLYEIYAGHGLLALTVSWHRDGAPDGERPTVSSSRFIRVGRLPDLSGTGLVLDARLAQDDGLPTVVLRLTNRGERRIRLPDTLVWPKTIAIRIAREGWSRSPSRKAREEATRPDDLVWLVPGASLDARLDLDDLFDRRRLQPGPYELRVTWQSREDGRRFGFPKPARATIGQLRTTLPLTVP